MHRRLWLFAGTAVAILSLAAAASATTKVAGVAHTSDATSAAAPFALSWANVPRTTAGRKAKSVLVSYDYKLGESVAVPEALRTRLQL